MAKPRVVVAGTLPAAGLDLLRERFVVDSDGSGAEGSAAKGSGAEGSGAQRGEVEGRALLGRVPGAAAIVANPAVPIDGRVLDAAGRSLTVVANFGVGYDNIDLETARRRGVRVTNTPGVVTEATAELAVALMLAAGRRIAEGDAIVRRGEWSIELEETFLGRGLPGTTVGLVGFGRIAQRVAELLRGFDVRVLFADRGGAPSGHGAERRELWELLAAADFVSLHVPLTPQTRHLIGADALGLMKPGGILVNTSRGAVVDTTALIEALRTGRLAAAGLDVYEDEPHVPAELRELPNTVLLPHIGSATAATRDAMARLVAENVIAVIDGREPPAAVV
jgi:glyoxylate reductase